MTALHNLVAFIAVLVAIVILSIVAAVLSWYAKPVEALGLSGAVTGLIGVLGTFRPRHTQAEPAGDAA